jgi:hypothetical protein
MRLGEKTVPRERATQKNRAAELARNEPAMELMQKLDIHDTASLVRYAIRHGARRRRFVNREIPDTPTRPRPTLNVGLRCLGAVHRAVILASSLVWLLVRNTHDGNRIGLAVR